MFSSTDEVTNIHLTVSPVSPILNKLRWLHIWNTQTHNALLLLSTAMRSRIWHVWVCSKHSIHSDDRGKRKNAWVFLVLFKKKKKHSVGTTGRIKITNHRKTSSCSETFLTFFSRLTAFLCQEGRQSSTFSYLRLKTEKIITGNLINNMYQTLHDHICLHIVFLFDNTPVF